MAARLGAVEASMATLLLKLEQLEIATTAVGQDLQRVLVAHTHTALQGQVLGTVAPASSAGAPSPAAADATAAASVNTAAGRPESASVSASSSNSFVQVQHEYQ